MTDQQLAEQFEVVFSGGPLLPERDGNSSLTDVAQPAHRNHGSLGLIQERPSRRGCPHQKYSSAHRQAVKALRADGLTLGQIAERTQIPVGTVYAWIMERIR